MKRQAILSSQSKTVYVAMSGGVDSSVAAALLKERGFKVVGVFMKPWQPKGFKCLWQEDREFALRVASQLGIPLLTWDFSKAYKRKVADYMISEYKAGRTPNPDVMCNKEIKFGLFADRSLFLGADYIATGHYVRTKRGRLYTALDSNKDQSYFLWSLNKNQLAKCLFPIGEYKKSEVRKLAQKFNLPNFNKPDSQGVCFVGNLDVKDFLTNYIKPKPGKILNKSGQVIGRHDGSAYYTIGQRHGLNIKLGGGPYFIVSKNIIKNEITVGSESDLKISNSRIKDLSWIGPKPSLPAKFNVRTRYRSKFTPAVLKPNGDVIFKSPERAVTSGQSIVFYRKDQVFGGGILE